MTPDSMTITLYDSFLGPKKDLLVLKWPVNMTIGLYDTFVNPQGCQGRHIIPQPLQHFPSHLGYMCPFFLESFSRILFGRFSGWFFKYIELPPSSPGRPTTWKSWKCPSSALRSATRPSRAPSSRGRTYARAQKRVRGRSSGCQYNRLKNRLKTAWKTTWDSNLILWHV